MWIFAAGDFSRLSVGVVDFANISLFCSGVNIVKTVIYNFKYIKSLYIIDIKSALNCQFDSFDMSNK